MHHSYKAASSHAAQRGLNIMLLAGLQGGTAMLCRQYLRTMTLPP